MPCQESEAPRVISGVCHSCALGVKFGSAHIFLEVTLSQEEKDSTRKRNSGQSVGLGIALGVAVGTAIGAAIDNVGAGITIGVAIGAGIGAALGVAKK